MSYASLRQGLVGAWCPSLGPSGYTLLDRSGYGNHGTLTNMDAGTDWVGSRYGWALDFDGTDDGIRIPNNNLTRATGSLSFWIRSTTDAVRAIFAVQQTADFNNIFAVYLGNNVSGSLTNELISIIRIRAGAITIAGLETTDRNLLLDGNWHSVVIGSNGSSYFLVIDGFEYAMTFISGTNGAWTDVVSPTDVSIGCRLASTNTPNLSISGQINDVRLYDKALTLSESRILAIEPGIGLKPKRTSVFFGAQLFNAAWAKNSNQLISAGVI
jgi:hypothetical protein